ncbi:hypothetical protein [Cellulomonas telluris]|uniref:hypothetical protein n=1 Tax=Cellulomonas telluris TaxID=2306636 RepID=UPI0010A7B0CB|nr:hypothetical protein [Cellulomonas telluris]
MTAGTGAVPRRRRAWSSANEAVVLGAAALWRVGGSRALNVATLVLFALMGTFFAVVIFVPPFQGVVDGVPFVAKTSRVPDEFRHIGNILLYAERPVAAGPFLSDVTPETLWLGEVERFPSYLYYWLMSFPARGLLAAGIGYEAVVVVLRLLTVVTGIGCLLVLRALLRGAGVGAATTGWSVLALALTGRFVWQSAGVSYDTPSMLLFLLVLLAMVHLLRQVTVVWSLVLVAAASAASITKYTFFPFVAAGVVVLVVVLALQGRRHPDPGLRARLVAELRERRVLVVLLGVLALVCVALLVERIGLNLLVHGSANPSCDVIHTAEECTVFDIYRRNREVRETYLAEVAGGVREPQRLDLPRYALTWAGIYYESTFFYRGRDTDWELPGAVALLGRATILAGALVGVAWIRRLLRTPAAVVVGGVCMLYVAGVFVFNLRTWLSLDQYYAHSGRYLLPVLGVAVAAALTAALWTWQRCPRAWRGVAAVLTAAVLLAVALTHNPVTAFLPYVDHPAWFTDGAADVLIDR